MATPTQSPILITSLGAPHKPTTKQTYDYLHAFLETIPSSTARTQLERLTDAIGVDIGAIAAGEGERREAERIRVRMERRAERKRVKEEDEKRELEGLLEDDKEEEFQEEEGAALEDDLEDGGDVEYGDNIVDEDEPDQDDGTEQDEVYLDQQANTVSSWLGAYGVAETDLTDVIHISHCTYIVQLDYNIIAMYQHHHPIKPGMEATTNPQHKDPFLPPSYPVSERIRIPSYPPSALDSDTARKTPYHHPLAPAPRIALILRSLS
jgi:hypothetical protein